LICDGQVLFERFKARSLSSQRHPGHVDSLNFEEFRPILERGKRDHLNLSGTLFDIDVTNFNLINKSAIDAIRRQMHG
jgi:hypothetical protein